MDNYVGKRLDGRYEIQEIIGVGGMSVVYKAYDNVDDRIVAVKILKEEFLTNDDFVRRFKNESKAIALLSHPNIVKVYDVSFGEKLQYIVMEYVDGITLKEYIQKQNAITWNEALFFTTQILKALQHAHDKGIVHRDVKPQNIILLSNGNIKVADFGIARFSRSDTKTLTDTAIGSVHYISPEQAKGEFTDERADIYSVGVVLYEMLTGKVPFEADNPVSVALMQLQKDAKKVTEINPDIPLGLEQICIHAMQKNPADRYQTATEMLLDVEEVSKNPNAVFDYSYFVDKEPTKYVTHTDDNFDASVAESSANQNQEPQEEELYDDDLEELEFERKRKRNIAFATFIGIVVLIAAIVIVVVRFTNGFGGAAKPLEDFVGMSYDELISSNSYSYEFTLEQQKTDEYESGIIIEQIPEAGTKVLADSQVKLVVAVSSDDISVPNLYNLTKDKAILALKNEGLLNYNFTTVASDSTEEGKVVYSNPKAGSVVSANAEITVYLSSGPTTKEVLKLTVPDVRGLSKDGAKAFLEKLGFDPNKITFAEEDSEVAKNIVIDQSPSAGTTVTDSDSIKIIISSGVTTTTTKASSKIAISVSLPTKYSDATGKYKTDQIVIYVDDKQYSTQTVELNGKRANFDVDISTDEAQIKVVLEETGTDYVKTVDGTKSQSLTVDFTSASDTETN